MNPALLSSEAYASLRGLQALKKMKINFMTVEVRKELVRHGLAVVDGPWCVITDLGKSVPRIVRAA